MNARPNATQDSATLPGHGPLAWWGALLGIIALAMMMLTFWFAYVYLAIHAETWPLNDSPPSAGGAVAATVVLLVSLASAAGVRRAGRSGHPLGLQSAAVVTGALGVAAIVLVAGDLDLPVRPSGHAAVSVFATSLIVLATALAGGIGALAVLVMRVTGPWGERLVSTASAIATWWTGVVVLWLPTAVLLYGAPRMVGG